MEGGLLPFGICGGVVGAESRDGGVAGFLVSATGYCIRRGAAECAAVVRLAGGRETKEALLNSERVLIGASGPAVPARLDTALKLGEDADMPAEARVRVKQIALEKEAVARLRIASESGVAEEI